jgi:hypothetical protein
MLLATPKFEAQSEHCGSRLSGVLRSSELGRLRRLARCRVSRNQLSVVPLGRHVGKPARQVLTIMSETQEDEGSVLENEPP